MAFDGDADDRASESHCSDGTSCIAGVRQTMSSDYIGVRGVRHNCSDDYSKGDGRRADCPAGAAKAVAGADSSRREWLALDFESANSDSGLAQVSARPVVLQSWNCSVSRSALAEAVESAATVALKVLSSAYPIRQLIPYYACRES